MTPRRGMVASSQRLAGEIGAAVLRAGGNAADAAVATAAALNVTEPTSTGLGGDMFAMYFDAATGKVTALNGSGRAPAALTLEKVGGTLSPRHGHTITVPGACAGWCDLIARHGSLPMKDLLAPAIELAEGGFPVAPVTAQAWAMSVETLRKAPGGTQLLAHGRAPGAGETWKNPGLARTLRAIAAGGKAAYYRGEIARAIVDAVAQGGGAMSLEDLAAHESTWDEPISTVYRGLRVWECPPNGQGIVALMALNLLEGFELRGQDPMGTERWHLMIEAVRLAFADAAHVADPRVANVPAEELLSKEYAAKRRSLIDPGRAAPSYPPGRPAGPDTVYFCTVDRHGNACSFINSNYMGFGTGIVPEGWGFSLQNRGLNFSLEPGHPNALAPRKRPYHTIIPGMLTTPEGALVGPFGVMGGFMQPQGHVQVVVGLVDDGASPQEALDRPRFCAQPEKPEAPTLLETGLPATTSAGLAARGHRIEAELSGVRRFAFGRGQILRLAHGSIEAGSDRRCDGAALSG